MLKTHLNEYLKKYNLNISQLSKETGISRKALTLLSSYNDNVDKPVSIQYNTMEILCQYFKIDIGSLISYEYEQEYFEVSPISFKIGQQKNLSLFICAYRTVINSIEKVYYFPVLIKLANKTDSQEIEYELPKAFWGEIDKNKIEDTNNKIFYTPEAYEFYFEVVLDESYSKIMKYIENTPFEIMIKNESLIKLTDEQIASLMKSFKKGFLSELTSRFLEFVLDDSKDEARISVNWNFGYYSFMHSSDFIFEYEKNKNFIIGLSDDNLIDPLAKHTIPNEELNSKIYPSSALL